MNRQTGAPDMPTDAEKRAIDLALIRRLVERDEAALAALYDRYGGLVFSVASRILNDAQSAEEILQDIFQHLWASASRFDPARGSLAGWLVVTTRNRSIDRLRRRTPASAADTLPQDIALPFNLEDSVLRGHLMNKVRGVIERLPKEQRILLDLAFFEGMTHSEIAARAREPLGTVKSRLRAAVAFLKKELAP
jgi:RNA polymerase sigma-70 factor (ECF subfamily)